MMHHLGDVAQLEAAHHLEGVVHHLEEAVHHLGDVVQLEVVRLEAAQLTVGEMIHSCN